eukprot:13748432-Heterocapsa_arctica.AAC.1
MRGAWGSAIRMEVFKVAFAPRGGSKAKYLIGIKEHSDFDQLQPKLFDNVKTSDHSILSFEPSLSSDCSATSNAEVIPLEPPMEYEHGEVAVWIDPSLEGIPM